MYRGFEITRVPVESYTATRDDLVFGPFATEESVYEAIDHYKREQNIKKAREEHGI